ncbi:diacylglycerol kinase family protein [Zavarzinia compransoris]|uniref:Diacylglycerol kinase n=1 Tax=Zavarzinia compransoris TaxID=1264899 RepID=A0A317E4A1_9PROT|nr:diacylglycerol kinase family protein [Zavarzinia compransoris]PWR21948.1 diacylglycerol kinase [Zavarzinia compransoris]TDP47314.1 diacylglycerol kinase family enzyme [Zavarzinia compransoris]
MRITVVMNEKAGTLAQGDGHAIATGVRNAFAHAGHTVNVAAVKPRDMQSAVQRSITTKPDVLVVGGGDGSLNGALNMLGRAPIALGVLPLGTMNLTARDIGLPPDPVDAAKAMARGTIAPVDVANLNGTRFLHAAVLGFYPWMVLDRDRARRRRGLSKWPAMIRAGWRALFRRHELEIDVDLGTDAGDRVQLRTPLLVVANNRFVDGAGPVPTRASLADGELAVYVAETTGPLSLLRLAAAVAAGRWESAPGIHFAACRSLTVASSRRRLRVAVDGELMHFEPPLSFRLEQGRLYFLMPSGE